MWAAIDNAYGDYTVTKGFKTKREAVDYVARNCDSSYKVSRKISGEYEVDFSGETETAYVCREEYVETNGYVS